MADIAELSRVEITILQGEKVVDLIFGHANAYKFGWGYFRYKSAGDPSKLYNGKIQFINFVYTVLFPEADNAFQFVTQAAPGVIVATQPFFKPSPQAMQVAGNIVNPLANSLANFKP